MLPLWRCLERRGGPDVYVTEYFRVHRGSHPEREILRSLTHFETGKKLIAQMIGNEAGELVRTARFLQDHSPCAGIDLNLGCPSPTVCGKTAGGALLRQPELVRDLVETLRPMVRGSLTLKTRLGYDAPEEFADLLELYADLPIDGLAVHGRTVKERYQSEVHVDAIARAVERLPYPVVANGSMVSARTAWNMRKKTGAAGLMLGRGAIRDPWVFAEIRRGPEACHVERPTLRDLRHYLEELLEEVRAEGSFPREIDLVNRMKKFTNYIASGLSGGEFVQELRRATSLAEFRRSCQTHLDRGDSFPAEPEEDGTLFRGFRVLADALAVPEEPLAI